MSDPTLEALQYYRDTGSDKFGWVKAPIRVVEDACGTIEKLLEETRRQREEIAGLREQIAQLIMKQDAEFQGMKAKVKNAEAQISALRGGVAGGKWCFFEDTTHGYWGIELEEAGNDDDPIMYPIKIHRDTVARIVDAHNATTSSTDGWNPIETYPKTGETFDVLYENGSIEHDVYWSDTRYCMLGSPQGSRGPGLVSTEAGNLPIDPEDGIVKWRFPLSTRSLSSPVTEGGEQ